MKDWCEEHQIYGLQRENVLFHVKSMDLTYLKFMAEKAKRK